MNTTVYPSLQMFERKCGIGDLFAEGHFNDTEEGLTKPQALARVAMWSAVKDYFKIAECLTPGQAATIVDAAPMIIGKDVEKLNKVKTLFDLHGFVFENAKKWDKGIVVCSQLWSLHHLANGKIPKETFYNSKISDKDYLQSALVAHFLERGDLEKSDPKTAYAIMFDADGILNKIEALAKTGNASKTPESIQDKAATILDMAKSGNFIGLANVGLFEEYDAFFDSETRKGKRRKSSILEHEFDDDVKPKKNAIGGDGGFMGVKNMAQIRQLSFLRSTRKFEESFRDYLSRTPLGHFVAIEAMKYTKSGIVPEDDILTAALKGMDAAIHTFSPVVIPSVSKVKVRQFLNDVQEELPPQMNLFGDKPVSTKDTKEFENIPYAASRFPAHYSRAYGPKYILMELDEHRPIAEEIDVKQIKARLTEIIDGLVSEEITREEAIDIAKAQYADEITGKGEKLDSYALTYAGASLSGGQFTSLDRKIGDDGKDDVYNLISDDRVEEVQHEDRVNNLNNNPESEEFMVSVLDFEESLDMPQMGSFEAVGQSYDRLHEVVVARGMTNHINMLEKLSTMEIIPQEEDIDVLKDKLNKDFPGSEKAIACYSGMLKKICQTFNAAKDAATQGEFDLPSFRKTKTRSVGDVLKSHFKHSVEALHGPQEQK